MDLPVLLPSSPEPREARARDRRQRRGPGLLRGTKMTARLSSDVVKRGLRQSALQKMVDLDDVADQVVTFCRTDSTTGQVLMIDSGRVYREAGT